MRVSKTYQKQGGDHISMRKYKYHGYTFFATPNFIYTKVRRFDKLREEIAPVYHIEGLKDAATRPFLTSINQCKNYIDLQAYIKERRERDGEIEA